MTEEPIIGPYVRGRLRLAGVKLRGPLAPWLDAVYAIWADAPVDVLSKMATHMTRETARLRPEEARATWGLRPEHQALAAKPVMPPAGGPQHGGVAPPRRGQRKSSPPPPTRR